MTTHSHVVAHQAVERAGARTAAFYGVLLANIGSFGILFFWIIGTVLLVTRNGGHVFLLQLDGLERWLYFAYPAVVLVSLGAWLLHLLRLDRAALALAGLPIVAAILYYLYLVSFRPI